MRRTSWAALGGVIAALAVTAVGANVPALALAAAAAGVLALVARSLRFRHSVAVLPFAVGALVILGRAILGVALAPPALEVSQAPAGTHHTAVVTSLGTPDGGLQRAVVQLRPPEPAEAVYV